MKRYFARAGWLAMTCILAGLSARAVEIQEVLVENRGPGMIEDEAVRAFISIAPGQEFDRMAVARDLKALEKSGRFSYVETAAEMLPQGVAVKYTVHTKPIIRRLEISGANNMGNKKVREHLELGAGSFVDEASMAVAAQKVRDAYHKRYFPNAKIAWTIDPDPETGQAVVRVRVDEGRRAMIKQIDFEGNEDVTPRRLRKAMKQRLSNWLSWITNDGVYDPGQLEVDCETIRALYLAEGRLDARVLPPEVKPVGRKGIAIDIGIDAGPQYRIRRLRVEGITLFPVLEVQAIMNLKPGDVASITAIDAAAQAIRDYYGSRGYIKTAIEYVIDADPSGPVVDLTFRVREGALAFINGITVRGNTRTQDRVVRRELSVYPGDIYNEVKVRTSQQRIRNLGYFSYVNTYPESTPDPQKYDLLVEVEEQRTGQFVIGAGFSSIDNLVGFAELSQGNFDLFGWPNFTGGGQKIKLRGQFGTERRDYELTFIEPWFLNRRLSLGVDLFHRQSSYYSNEYDQRNTGMNLSLGKGLNSFDRIRTIYGLESFDIYNVSENASDQIKEEAGKRTKSSLTQEWIHDSRDNPFIPSRGNRTTLAATLAGGPLGADTDLYLLQARSSQFFPLWFDHVFNLRGWTAVVQEYGGSDRVPIFDRLFLGGARTLRGFKYRDVGPRDDEGEPIGGRTAAYATAEYTLPVVEKVRLAGFYDIGMVWKDAYEYDFGSLNSDIGLGIRLDFPGFPIQLDYAWPLETDEYNDRSSGRFSFWIGYTY